jgi:alanine dehydrogenase
VKAKDIVVTSTPSIKPVIRSAWIGDGTHINAIGADAKGKEELDPAILKRAKVVVDDTAQAIHSGEINVPIAKKILNASGIHATLGQIINGMKKGRASRSDITVFDSTGLAIQDMAVAQYVYRKARKSHGAGQKVDFIS